MKGLFINSKQANCSIYESGIMCYNALQKSKLYTIDYSEESILDSYDFYVFNYHYIVLNNINKALLLQLPGLKMAIVTEVAENNPLIYTPDIFDLYLVIDPSIKETDKIYAFPRPLEEFNNTSIIKNDIIIGSFGFLTDGKRFDWVIDAVENEFDFATIRFNFPRGTYVQPATYNKNYEIICNRANSVKNGIKVEITTDYMDKNELIEWCSQNTLNCFFYDRQIPGLSAVTDQAISSGSPLSVNNNSTFRHILKYIKPYPDWSLKYSIENSKNIVNQIKIDWSSDAFYKKFESILINK